MFAIVLRLIEGFLGLRIHAARAAQNDKEIVLFSVLNVRFDKVLQLPDHSLIDRPFCQIEFLK